MTTITLTRGRMSLMAIIGVALIVAVVLLFTFARGGAIGSKNQLNGLIKFLGFYVPLISLVATFFFQGRGDEVDIATPVVPFYFAIFIVGIWVLTPILLLVSGLYIEEVLEYIDRLIPIGQSLALMALGYYFRKSS
jgi:hypothetical protein